MQYLAVFGRQRSGHDAPPRGVRERGSARRTGPTIKRVTNWAKLGQFPSRIKLRKPRGPPLWADAVAKVDVDLAAATMETNKPLAPFENGGIGGALRRQGPGRKAPLGCR